MSKELHIVSFDVPFPPNYGGVIDVYYKIKALKKLGVKVHLHCFQYGRSESEKLLEHCESVVYYKRKKFVNPFSSSVPYIVKSRINKKLISNLNKDNNPILLEGLHSTWPIISQKVDKNRIYVRTHNIEHEYYKRLESVEKSVFKRTYFKLESGKLKAYERVLSQAKGVIAISKFDKVHFAQHNHNTIWASAFHESTEVNSSQGNGQFALYHGNLSVGENNHAAIYLATEIFPKVHMPCLIVGNNPSKELMELCEKNNIQLKSNIGSKEIIQLVKDAHINVLPTFQQTGIKLKLLNSLFRGKHCIVNNPMIDDTGLEDLCYVANTSDMFVDMINELENIPFSENEIKHRVKVLQPFKNKENAKKIIDTIF